MRLFYLTIIFSVVCHSLLAQTPSYNFRRVTGKDGLSDGVVGPIAQDKYGYLWFGTLSGLNRYDGYKVTNFIFNNNDSFSVPPDFVRTILCDRAGTIWCGYATGLYRFDYATTHFILVPATKDLSINEIKQGAGGQLVLLTGKGLASFNTINQEFSFYQSGNDRTLIHKPMYEGCVYKSSVYIAADTGIVVYNTGTGETSVLSLSKSQKLSVRRLVIDSTGTLWAFRYDNGAYVYKGVNNNTSFDEITSFRYSVNGSYENIQDMYVDAQNRLLLSTVWRGLVIYNTRDNSYSNIVNDPRMPNSLPENHLTKIFVGRQGFVWLGTEGSGVAYFHPEHNLFKVFFPEPLKMVRPHIWSRAIAEDKSDNLWMGTGTGLVKQNTVTGLSTLYNRDEIAGIETIHNNSIRSLLCDDENNVWIGTASGVNVYENSTGKIKFLDETDSLPKSFYWALLQDHTKTIWFGSTWGLFYKLPGSSNFYSLHSHPALKPYAGYGVRSLLEDSRGNLWIGFNGKGLLLYDVRKRTIQYWNELGSQSSPRGRIITSMAEDKKGVLWFSSYYGIASYDYTTGKFTSYADIKAMESLQISGLQADDEDRLWLASPRGLLMLDRERKFFKRFNVEDGLPDIEFNDQMAYKLKNGQFVYPTYDGFVEFDPLKYRERNSSTNILISDFNIPRRPLASPIDVRDLTELSLASDQNFFTIELTAFNYSNPRETWYAYQLEGFDRDWIYTRNRVVNYTNVPGGNYVFHFKASSDPNNWRTKEKKLDLHIATVFYRTWWFITLMVLLIPGIVFYFYRNRIRQREKLMKLESKAQLLEKEKTHVMYENLKQQLNPHFLFNSLTSLSSLISVNPSMAGKFLDSLSKTYRYILKSSNHDTVPLVNEIKFAESYISLQQTRFESGLRVCIRVGEEYLHRLIVPVTLQNMIENAIKHNVLDAESPLVIEIYIEGDSIIIRNNLQKKNFVETSNRQGLANLKSLYHYLCRQPVEIDEGEKFFTVKIPLL